jgi:hypothetical protein
MKGEIQIKAQLNWYFRSFKLPISGTGDYETLRFFIKSIFNFNDDLSYLIEYTNKNEFYVISSQEDLWNAIDKNIGNNSLSLYITEIEDEPVEQLQHYQSTNEVEETIDSLHTNEKNINIKDSIEFVQQNAKVINEEKPIESTQSNNEDVNIEVSIQPDNKITNQENSTASIQPNNEIINTEFSIEFTKLNNEVLKIENPIKSSQQNLEMLVIEKSLESLLQNNEILNVEEDVEKPIESSHQNIEFLNVEKDIRKPSESSQRNNEILNIKKSVVFTQRNNEIKNINESIKKYQSGIKKEENNLIKDDTIMKSDNQTSENKPNDEIFSPNEKASSSKGKEAELSKINNLSSISNEKIMLDKSIQTEDIEFENIDIKNMFRESIDLQAVPYKKIVQNITSDKKDEGDIIQNIIKFITNECSNQNPDEINHIKENIRRNTQFINNDIQNALSIINKVIGEYSKFKNIFLGEIMDQLDNKNNTVSPSSLSNPPTEKLNNQQTDFSFSEISIENLNEQESCQSNNQSSNKVNDFIDQTINQISQKVANQKDETIECIKDFFNNLALEIRLGVTTLLDYIDDKDEIISKFILGYEYSDPISIENNNNINNNNDDINNNNNNNNNKSNNNDNNNIIKINNTKINEIKIESNTNEPNNKIETVKTEIKTENKNEIETTINKDNEASEAEQTITSSKNISTVNEDENSNENKIINKTISNFPKYSRTLFNTFKNTIRDSITGLASSSKFVDDVFSAQPLEHESTSEIIDHTTSQQSSNNDQEKEEKDKEKILEEDLLVENTSDIQKKEKANGAETKENIPIIEMNETDINKYINNGDIEILSNGIINYEDLRDIEKLPKSLIQNKHKLKIPIDELSPVISDDSYDYNNYSPTKLDESKAEEISDLTGIRSLNESEELELLRAEMSFEEDSLPYYMKRIIFNRTKKSPLTPDNSIGEKDEPLNERELLMEKGREIYEQEYKNVENDSVSEEIRSIFEEEFIKLDETIEESTYDNKVQGKQTASKSDNQSDQFETFEFDIYDDPEIERQIKQKKKEDDLLTEYEII